MGQRDGISLRGRIYETDLVLRSSHNLTRNILIVKEYSVYDECNELGSTDPIEAHIDMTESNRCFHRIGTMSIYFNAQLVAGVYHRFLC